ncbi:hypothetical protein G5714_017940 [Onychostoma macrolepis]|uniref:Uncharacterized protein n=1 Tax=Onychostoma macrolepis TaxID=369639 RepID=A0A7J6C2J2_9TELE|nr:hypothetical protein G5714_017940 [Onychostoma macrolepis]
MYLYKATCPDIPTPKQKGGQKERGQSRCGKQNTGGKLYPPLVCLRSNSQVELKHLEEFLNVHTLSLQDSVRARTGMAYSVSSGVYSGKRTPWVTLLENQ